MVSGRPQPRAAHRAQQYYPNDQRLVWTTTLVVENRDYPTCFDSSKRGALTKRDRVKPRFFRSPESRNVHLIERSRRVCKVLRGPVGTGPRRAGSHCAQCRNLSSKAPARRRGAHWLGTPPASAALLSSALRAEGVFSDHRLQHVFLQTQLAVQLLQPCVLLAQMLYFAFQTYEVRSQSWRCGDRRIIEANAICQDQSPAFDNRI